MNTKNDEKDVGAAPELAPYVQSVIEQLEREQKYAAMHGHLCALHSFEDFAGDRGVPLPMDEVFTSKRLKEYEEWLLYTKKKPLQLNSVASYMSSLCAVYNRWRPAGTPEHNPKMFADVYTRVVSQAKRASRLAGEQAVAYQYLRAYRPGKRVLVYFSLMFLCRGIPFIDLAYLRQQDLQGNNLVYLRQEYRCGHHRRERQCHVHCRRNECLHPCAGRLGYPRTRLHAKRRPTEDSRHGCLGFIIPAQLKDGTYELKITTQFASGRLLKSPRSVVKTIYIGEVPAGSGGGEGSLDENPLG